MLHRTRATALACFFVVITTRVAPGSLVEYLPLQGNATAIVGTSGTLNGPTSPNTVGPGPVSGPFGSPDGALGFNGLGDYVSVAGGGGLNDLQTGTIDLFVKWSGAQDSSTSGYGSILARQSNDEFSNDVLQLDNANPASAHVIWNPYGELGTALTSTTTVGDGVWHNVAITFSSGAQQLYIDGVLNDTSTYAGTISDSPTTPLTIGAWIGDGNGPSTSSISDFRVYNTILSQGEIQALSAVPEPTSLVMLSAGILGALYHVRRRLAARANVVHA